jgi:undecaprenyl-diphosphatase
LLFKGVLMPFSLDQILPSLESLGLWSYWIIGLAAMLEAFFVTGVFIPGTLVVDAGGILVQQGTIDFFDLVWFVAIGSILGGEVGYWAGQLTRRGLSSRWQPERSRYYQRSVRLFERHGGVALIMGRFLGPVSGLVPLAASVAGMNRRQFILWNILSGFPYALAHVAFGYFVGEAASQLGPMLTRVGLLAIAVLVLLAVLWWIVARVIRFLPLAISLLASMGRAVIDHPEVQTWAHAHPQTAAFIAGRFDRDRFWGLTATFLLGTALYILAVWIGTVFDFLMLDPIVMADTRLANLIHAFWTPGLLRASAHLTALGDWRVVLSLALAASAGLLALRRYDLVLGLGVTLAGQLASVSVLKRVFHRPRSDLGYFLETSGSFPSGHAAISVAFYGFLFYILWRLRILRALPAAIAATTLAFLMGLSRIYLIEHYLTDVINGWLIGALCLVIGVAVAEWRREGRIKTDRTTLSAPVRISTVLIMLLLTVWAAWQVAVYEKARNVAGSTPGDVAVQSVEEAFGSGRLPGETESIAGTPLEPINLIILASHEDTLNAAMEAADWIRAENPSFGALLRAAWSAWTNQADDTAPVTPYFWRNLPNDLAFQKPTADETLRRRHHVRFWRSEFVTVEGLRIYVGAASFDDGLDWGLLHHINPNIDTERDVLSGDLQGTGRVAELRSLRLSEPRLGQSVAGDPWFSDGMARVMVLR